MMLGDLEDPLIAWDLRNLQRIATTILFLLLVFFFSWLNRKNRYVLWAIFSGAILTFIFLLVTRNNHGLAFFTFKFW
ncbi:hypothetical protein [Coleofasciculus sp. FACHB-129]|uniref:hypothetical protein n=2 Tax=Cyanophyceae TaxID=3028117 RepID=UPI00168A2CB8|nr:hypothetical protein [Coleofasciculus sp. FACHB-129]MBD1898200.1 hypothetical protein [Coleofasciculus sp. FACHB-129]